MELTDIADILTKPGKGISAADESPQTLGKRGSFLLHQSWTGSAWVRYPVTGYLACR